MIAAILSQFPKDFVFQPPGVLRADERKPQASEARVNPMRQTWLRSDDERLRDFSRRADIH
jgi:hypothetical protein